MTTYKILKKIEVRIYLFFLFFMNYTNVLEIPGTLYFYFVSPKKLIDRRSKYQAYID